MNPKASAENSIKTNVHHRWPFLPNDNGRFTGPLIYRGVHTPPPEDKPLLHQMQKDPMIQPTTSESRRYLQAAQKRSNGILYRHMRRDSNNDREQAHFNRMERDQAAAQLRRQGILKSFNS